MGASSWIKNKAKEAIVNAKAERAYNIEQKLERRQQYNKGYNEGLYKKGLAEGSRPEPPQPAQRGSSGRRSSFKSSGDLFSGGGLGIGFGFGEEKPRQAMPPQRVTRISKSGAVTISEPYERKQIPVQQDPLGDFWGGAAFPSGSPSKKGEREKHPYDPF